MAPAATQQLASRKQTESWNSKSCLSGKAKTSGLCLRSGRPKRPPRCPQSRTGRRNSASRAQALTLLRSTQCRGETPLTW